MFTVYVLHSETHKKIYIGFTSDLNQRMLSHNELATKGWTKSYRPWTLIYSEEYTTKTQAMLREKQLKSGSGREFIWNIIEPGDL